MEEKRRSFGYICPHCGKAVLGSRTVFALTAAAARIECECGKAEMDIETDGTRFTLSVPCGLCGEQHTAVVEAAALLEGRGVGLACPKTKQICCYAGEEGQVRGSMEELAIRAAKEKSESPEAFTDNVIMYEVLSELKDIAARPNGITCGCGSHDYSMEIRRDAVELTCRDCGARLRLSAATDRDLDDLCCHMKLVIPGGK